MEDRGEPMQGVGREGWAGWGGLMERVGASWIG